MNLKAAKRERKKKIRVSLFPRDGGSVFKLMEIIYNKAIQQNGKNKRKNIN